MNWTRWLWVGVIAITSAGALAIPRPPGIVADAAVQTTAFAVIAAAAIAGLVASPLAARSPAVKWWWPAGALLLGVGSYLFHDSVRGRCVAEYTGKGVAIGTELLPWAAEYKRAFKDKKNDDLLFDAGGLPQRVWTESSISRCQSMLRYTYFPWFPLCASALLTMLAGAVAKRPFQMRSQPRTAPLISDVSLRYDAFISYRHGGEDAQFARDLLIELERNGFSVSIDERDFRANESFLIEMERCIRESRFIVAVVSPRYLESGNCSEEAVITKTMDMADRRRRLIPLIIAPVTMPAWMYSIVGIDFTNPDPVTDPMEKLKATLREPGGAAKGASIII
jgi:hypothetical protein